jgi:hypothetical protein
MSILSNFKLVSSKRTRSVNPVQLRRHKVIRKIQEQIYLAIAQKEGRTYAPTKIKNYVNQETGERKTVEVPKRIKEWWYIENGKINLILKYGSKQIAFDSKGTKNAIEVANGDDLIKALESLKLAVDAGELDTQIEAASSALRAGFIK